MHAVFAMAEKCMSAFLNACWGSQEVKTSTVLVATEQTGAT